MRISSNVDFVNVPDKEQLLYISSLFDVNEIVASFREICAQRSTFELPRNSVHINQTLASRYFLDQYMFKYRSLNQSMSPSMFIEREFTNTELDTTDRRSLSDEVLATCDIYPDSTAAAMIWYVNKYGAKTVLDFNAKWGVRLVAAAACAVNYIGFDSYLPAQDGYTRLIEVLESKPELTVHTESFLETIIYDEIDMVFSTLANLTSDIAAFNLITSAWSWLIQDKLLCLHVPRQLIGSSMEAGLIPLMKMQPGAVLLQKHSLDNLGEQGAILYVWKKGVFEPPALIQVSSTWSLGQLTLVGRALSHYLKSLPQNLVYIGDCYTKLTEEIVQLKPSDSKITVYVNETNRQCIDTLTVLGVTVRKYSSNIVTSDLLETVKVYTESIRGFLIPSDLNDPLFESALLYILKASLPRDAEEELIQPERVWIETNSVVLIRVLLTVWKSNTLLITHQRPNFSIKDSLPLFLKGRVVEYYNKDKLSLKQMKSQYGYKNDVVIK